MSTDIRRLLYKQDFIEVIYALDQKWLYVNWKGYQTEETVKSGCEQILSLMSSTGVTKILNDNTNVTGIWTYASKWVATDWFPRMRHKGLKHFAWVNSPKRLSQVSVQATMDAAPPGAAVIFDSLRQAEEWLAAQK